MYTQSLNSSDRAGNTTTVARSHSSGVEQGAHNTQVGGSNPPGTTN